MSGKALQINGADFTPTIHRDTYNFIKPEQVCFQNHINQISRRDLIFRKFNLQNRAVFITGASKGIGKETALSFAKAGASFIAIAARSPLEDLKKQIGKTAHDAGRAPPKVLALKVDVSDWSSVQQATKDVDSAFSRLDIVSEVSNSINSDLANSLLTFPNLP
jgi:hypothetical protein